MNESQDKVVLITGAGSGMGFEIARAFAQSGAKVAANDLTDINLLPLAAEIDQAGGVLKIFTNDISKKMALQTTITEVLETWERIDILVNHASVQPHNPLLDMDEWDWRRTVDVILTGTFLTTQSVGRVMRELGGGVILNVGPAPGDTPRAAYLAAKAGVVAFTRAAAEELAPDHIRVNAVCPGASIADAVSAGLDLCHGAETGKVIRC